MKWRAMRTATACWLPVDCICPPGIFKEEVRLDVWHKGIARSDELRNWFATNKR